MKGRMFNVFYKRMTQLKSYQNNEDFTSNSIQLIIFKNEYWETWDFRSSWPLRWVAELFILNVSSKRTALMFKRSAILDSSRNRQPCIWKRYVPSVALPLWVTTRKTWSHNWILTKHYETAFHIIDICFSILEILQRNVKLKCSFIWGHEF